MLRVIFMVGINEAHLEVLGYQELGRPVGEVLYRGSVAAIDRRAADAQELTEWLIEELCNVRKLFQA